MSEQRNDFGHSPCLYLHNFILVLLDKRVKPSEKNSSSVDRWSYSSSTRQFGVHRLAHADTQENHSNLEENTSSVTSYISKCVDDVWCHWRCNHFPTRKPGWMERWRPYPEPKKAAFRSGDKEAHSTAWARQKAGIKLAKQRHRERLERDLNTSNTKDMGQAIQTITGYKSRSAPIICEATLPDELNTFYASFDFLNKESAAKSTPRPDDQPLSVSTADVRRTLLRVHMSKAPGPDNISDCVLRIRANQLVDVITDIFNISLSQEGVPTCFQTTTIVPVKVWSVSSKWLPPCGPHPHSD